jgi:hypothetical protein
MCEAEEAEKTLVALLMVFPIIACTREQVDSVIYLYFSSSKQERTHGTSKTTTRAEKRSEEL